MHILVVGSRSIDDYKLIKENLDKFLDKNPIIVSGGAKGVDSLAEKYADENKLEKIVMKADWDKYGKSAGFIRNEEMHKFISGFEERLCIAFWDGKSKGTQHSFKLAEKYNNPIKIIKKENEENE